MTDILLSTVKAYNLYLESSITVKNLVNVEIRDVYLSQGVIKDFTNRLVKKDELTLSYVVDKNKRTNFKYKDDTDFYNSLYLDNYNYTFGTQIWEQTDNEWISNESVQPIDIVEVSEKDLPKNIEIKDF